VSLHLSRNEVVEDESIDVNVTLTDDANYTETFNVTLCGEFLWGWLNYTFPVHTFTGVTVTPGSTITLNTTVSLPAGFCVLKASAWRV
jgi:hypothetical protein